MSRRRRAAAAVVSEDEESEEEQVITPAHNPINNEMHEPESTDPVIQSINFATEHVLKVLAATTPCFSDEHDDVKTRQEEKMDDAVIGLVKLQMTYKQTTSIMSQVVEDLHLKDFDGDNAGFLEAIENIETITQKKLAEYSSSLTDDDVMASPLYMRLQDQMSTILSDCQNDDDDIALEDAETEAEVDLEESVATGNGEVIPELDPISKQRLRDPVRNQICRHIYGKASMIQLLKKNPRTRCPAMGCTNMNFVKVTDLQDDPKLTALVQNNGLHGEALAGASTPVYESPSNRRRR